MPDPSPDEPEPDELLEEEPAEEAIAVPADDGGGMIEFPAPNEQGVIVVRMMVIAAVGGGKTTLMGALSPEVCEDRERWKCVGPVRTLADNLGCEYHQLFGRDKAACDKFFGDLVRSNESCLLLLDEFDEFCPGGSTGASGGYSSEYLYRILNYARNKDPGKVHGNQIAIFVSARGTADITKNSIRCMDVVFFGQMWEGNAIKYLRESVRQGSIDFEKIVRNLPKYVFMVWCPQAGGFRGFIEVHPDGTWSPWSPDQEPPTKENAPDGSSEGSGESTSAPRPLPESSSAPSPDTTAKAAGARGRTGRRSGAPTAG